MKNEDSKVQLSKEEIRVLRELEFFRTKKIVTEKIYHQLSWLVAAIKSLEAFKAMAIHQGMDITSGKISKGENYLGLPYVMLDFPRLFTDEKIVAFRTMVWWGNFASNTLIRSVQEPEELKRISKQLRKLKGKEVFFCINESPWHHHFGNENYSAMDLLTTRAMENYISKNKFLKVARKIPLNQINRLKEFSLESFEIFSKVI